MHINATMFGQMITFVIFVWFTMRFIWPPLISQLNERKKRIADGLAAAEQGRKMLNDAEESARIKINEAKQHCYKMLEDADAKAKEIVAEAKILAEKERDEIVASGHTQVSRAIKKARTELQAQIAGMVVLGAEQILKRSINPEDHKDILSNLAKKLA